MRMPRQRSRDPVKGLTLVEIMNGVQNSKINAMYVQGENQAMSDPDQVHARKALAGPDHLVVQDIFLTEMAWFAGVILPGPRMDRGKDHLLCGLCDRKWLGQTAAYRSCSAG